MRTILCFLAIAVALVASQRCTTCANGCQAPYSGAACVNGAWVYQGDIAFSGRVNINCAISLTGSATFRSGTTLNLNSCSRLNVGQNFNAPNGVGISVDYQGQAARVGDRFVFATYGGRQTGYIGSVSVQNMDGDGQQPELNPRLQNGQALLAFTATSDSVSGNGDLANPVNNGNTGNNGNNGPVNDPDFDANGDRVRKCSTFTCTNPSVCNPITPNAVCDRSTGEWVIPESISAQSVSVACPIRIRGDFTVSESLTIGGCARINVDGTATLSRVAGSNSWNNRVSVHFNLNDFGRPRAGERINWLQAGQLVGGAGRVNFANIWDTTNSVQVANQRCGSSQTVLIVGSNERLPADDCNNNRDRAEGADDAGEFASFAFDDTDFVDAAIADVADEEFVDNFEAANHGGAGDFVDAAFGETSDFIFDEAVGDATDSIVPTTNANTASSSAPAFAYGLFALGVLILVALIVVQIQIVRVKRSRETTHA